MLKNFTFLFIGSFLLFIVFSCKKEKDDNKQATRLMSINFIDGYVPEDFEVLVFITDSMGNILADTNCPENKMYDIYSEPGLDPPSSFDVTIVRYDLFWHNLLIEMNTFTGIGPSSWTIKGNQPDTKGTVVVTLNNIPPNSTSKIFSTSGFYNYTVAVRPQTCLLYHDFEKLYFKTNITGEGPFYKLLPVIQPGDEISLDLSEMEAATVSPIELPFPPAYGETKLWAFAGNEYFPFQSYLTDLIYSTGGQSAEVQVSYPPGIFDNFRTSLLLQESFETNKFLKYNLIGSIPASVEKPQMDINFIQTSEPGKIEINTSGDYSASKTLWEFMTTNNELFQWSVYAPEKTKKLQLPDVSEKFMATFPTFEKDKLVPSSSELLDIQNSASYNDVLLIFFNELNPKVLEQVDYNSVILKTPSK